MGYADTMFILSNINCGLASGVSYLQARKSGANPNVATANLFNNIGNGVMRNTVAYDMQRHGCSWGNTVNMFAGYGNPVSNAMGTLGIMSACSPSMFFGCCTPMMMSYPMCFGGPMIGGFGHGHHGFHQPPMMGHWGGGFGFGGFCC